MKTEYIEYVEPPNYKNKDLLPCPFCGGKAKIHYRSFESGISGTKFMGKFVYHGEVSTKNIIWWVGCFNNTCWQPRVSGATKQQGVEFWNKRH